MMICCVPELGAEIVHLKSGNTVIGRITERSSYYIVIDKGGAVDKIFLNEIESIEDEPAPLENFDVDDFIKDVQIQSIKFDRSKFLVIPEEKVDLIVKFMVVNGAYGQMQIALEQAILAAPNDRRKEIKDLFVLSEIIEKLVPVYHDLFTEEDLTAMVNFFASPTGKKFKDSMPQIYERTAQVVIEYFQEKRKFVL